MKWSIEHIIFQNSPNVLRVYTVLRSDENIELFNGVFHK